MHDRIQELLMFIDMHDDDTKNIMEKVHERDGTWKGKERLVLPAFYLYRKMIGNGNGDNRITSFAYEIKTDPKYTMTLKSILNNQWIKQTI